MKKLNMLKFFIIFLFILGIYYFYILNIDKFIKSEDNILTSYSNNYDLDNSSSNAFDYLLHNYNIELISENELETIQNSSFLVNLLSNYLEMDENEILQWLETSGKTNINSISPKAYNYNAMYFTNEKGNIAFSLDHQNIVYSLYLPVINASSQYNDHNPTIDEVISLVTKALDNIGIIPEFDFSVTSVRRAPNYEYSYDVSSVFYLEDINNNIKITYDYNYNLILFLQIGFQN